MGYRLGIDLGTTFTAAAIANGQPPTVLGLGNRAMQVPSVLFLQEDGAFLVGEAAERRGAVEPHRVAREFKRRIGDHVPMLIAGTPHSPQSLTAHLLRWVVDTAATQLGERPAEITITHPAAWGGYRHELLDQVIALADVGPARTCPEPVAAAVQYSSHTRVPDGARIAVYDLGGGTFDVCVLEKTPGGFTILGVPEGIEHLGGVDFDEAVFHHVLAALGTRTRDLDLDSAEATAGITRLRRDCVDAKEALSADVECVVPVSLPGISTTVRLTRPELESLIRPAITGTVEAMERALRSAGTAAEDLDAIVLVGGSSRIPMVTQMLQAAFHTATALDTHPKHDVALGAVQVPHDPRTSRLRGPSAHPSGRGAPVHEASPAVGSAAAAGRAAGPPPAAGAPPPEVAPWVAAPPAAAQPRDPLDGVRGGAPDVAAAAAGSGHPAAPMAGTPGTTPGTTPPAVTPPEARRPGAAPGGPSRPAGGPLTRPRLIAAVSAVAVLAAVVAGYAVTRGDQGAPGGQAGPTTTTPAAATSTTPASPTTTATTTASFAASLPRSAPLTPTQLLVPMRIGPNWDIYLGDTASPAPVRRLTDDADIDTSPALSPDRRTAVWVHQTPDGNRTLRVAGAADGSGERELFDRVPSQCAGGMFRPAWQPPEGSAVAVACQAEDKSYGLYLFRVDGVLLRTYAVGQPRVDDPAFSPDGTAVAYWAGPLSGLDGGDIYTIAADGSAPPRQLTRGATDAQDADPTWSPDGSQIAFRRRVADGTSNGNFDVYLMGADGSGARAVVTGAADDQNPSFTPSGARIAFKSNRTEASGEGQQQASRVWLADLSGGPPSLLWREGTLGEQSAPSWSPR